MNDALEALRRIVRAESRLRELMSPPTFMDDAAQAELQKRMNEYEQAYKEAKEVLVWIGGGLG